MFNKLIIVLTVIYCLQIVVYHQTSKSYHKNSGNTFTINQLILPQNLDYILNMETTKKKSIDEDLWVCTTYKLGGNITPSIIYNGEYWRYIICFFLHFNVYHFLINALIIWYYSHNEDINSKSVFLFSVVNVCLSNVSSSLISPDVLKMGSSSLSVSLLGFSLLGHWSKRLDLSVIIDVALLFMFGCGFFSKSVDNVVHICSFINTIIFMGFRRKNLENIYLVIAGGYLIICGLIIVNMELTEEQTLAVLINYGCQE